MINISIDLGATNTRVAVIENHQIKKIKRFKTDKWSFKNWLKEIDRYLSKLEFNSINICSVGPLDITNGILLNLPNLFNDWQGIHLKEILQEEYHCEVNVDNDANVAALGQYLILKEKPQSLVYLTFSTGIGAGFIYEGKIYHGINNSALEIANAIPNYQDESTGFETGLEYQFGGNGLIKQFKHIGLNVQSTKDCFDLYYQNHPKALNVLNKSKHTCESFLSTLIYILNPKIIIIGGSVVENQKLFFDNIIKDVLETTKNINYQTEFKYAKDLENATLLGCENLCIK